MSLKIAPIQRGSLGRCFLEALPTLALSRPPQLFSLLISQLQTYSIIRNSRRLPSRSARQRSERRSVNYTLVSGLCKHFIYPKQLPRDLRNCDTPSNPCRSSIGEITYWCEGHPRTSANTSMRFERHYSISSLDDLPVPSLNDSLTI